MQAFFLPEFLTDIGALLLALLLGGLVGIQRELSGHEAGFRTNTLVCVGSALAMLVSIQMHESYGGDAGRIAAQVVSGIGFLGAGTIIRTGLTVHGLTTAAGLWVMACVGLAAGAKLYLPAIMGTLCCLGVMTLMGWIEERTVREKKNNVCSLTLEVDNVPGMLELLSEEIAHIDRNAHIDEICYTENNRIAVNVFIHTGDKKNNGDVMQILSQVKGVQKLTIMC